MLTDNYYSIHGFFFLQPAKDSSFMATRLINSSGFAVFPNAIPGFRQVLNMPGYFHISFLQQSIALQYISGTQLFLKKP